MSEYTLRKDCGRAWVDSQARSDFTGSITAMLKRLPERDPDVFDRLFRFYLDSLRDLASRRLRNANRRVRDEEDLAAEVLADFLMQGGDGLLPEMQSREDVLRMLAKRIRQRAINHVRDGKAQKRGGGLVAGESVLGSPDNSGFGGGLASFPDDAPAPDAPLIAVEELESVHKRVQQTLKDPQLIRYFELWAEGSGWNQMAEEFQVSRATVFRKLERIVGQLEREFSQPDPSGQSEMSM